MPWKEISTSSLRDYKQALEWGRTNIQDIIAKKGKRNAMVIMAYVEGGLPKVRELFPEYTGKGRTKVTEYSGRPSKEDEKAKDISDSDFSSTHGSDCEVAAPAPKKQKHGAGSSADCLPDMVDSLASEQL